MRHSTTASPSAKEAATRTVRKSAKACADSHMYKGWNRAGDRAGTSHHNAHVKERFKNHPPASVQAPPHDLDSSITPLSPPPIGAAPPRALLRLDALAVAPPLARVSSTRYKMREKLTFCERGMCGQGRVGYKM